ncbi:hypothetical protein RFI_38284, partial [Reticulomyxa filosa]
SYIILNDDGIKNNLIGMNQNNKSMMHLWPFTKQQMQSRNKKKISNNNDRTLNKYEEILNNSNYLNYITIISKIIWPTKWNFKSISIACFIVHILSSSSSALLKL